LGLARWWPAWVAVVLATLVRLSKPWVHFASGYTPPDADSAFHLRRAMAFVENPPSPALFDSMLAYPYGTAVPWPPGWDALLGVFGFIFSGGQSDGVAFAFGASLVPLIVGVLTVCIAMSMAARLGGRKAALCAGLILALAPQHVSATQFGRIDHHGAEGFWLLLLSGIGVLGLKNRTVALIVLCASLCWVGAFLYVVIGMFALLVVAVTQKSDASGVKSHFSTSSLAGFGVGAGLLLIPAALNGAEAGAIFSYSILSLFHPVLLGVVSLGAAWLVVVRFLPEYRIAALLGGALALVVALVYIAPAVLEGVREWLGKSDELTASVAEMYPIFSLSSFEAAIVPARLLGLGWYVLPFATVWAFRSEGWLRGVAVVALILWLLTLTQNRFGWALAPIMAVVLGVVLGRFRLAPLMALLLFVRTPAEAYGAWVAPKTEMNRRPWAFEAYRFLGEIPSSVGVAASWNHGHWITVLGGKGQYVGHFGVYAGGAERAELAASALSGSPTALLSWMDGANLPYLLIESREILGDSPLRALIAGGGASGELEAVAGLCPVFASSPDPGVPLDVPGAWIYERRLGATFEGVATPGSEVTMSLPIQLDRGVTPWTVTTQANEDGIWRITTPCATREGLMADESAVIFRDGQYISLEVPSGAVRDGALISFL
jgi:hypothetical protein